MGYFNSAIGRKQVMGATGIAWALFVLTHMLGNILIFAGPDVYNHYSYSLTSNPFIILAEAGLVATLLFHVVDGFWLTVQNKYARPIKAHQSSNGKKAARFQSKWMIYHGLILLVFIVLHLITFKYGPAATEGYTTTVNGVQMRDLYRLVLEVFRQPGYIIWYTVCMIAIGFHLSHGFYSSFASLGFYHPKYSPWLSRFGYFYGAMIAVGFIAPPLYVFFVLR